MLKKISRIFSCFFFNAIFILRKAKQKEKTSKKIPILDHSTKANTEELLN